MAAYDFLSVRLFVDAPLGEGQPVALDKTQQNYLGNVLRLKAGARILVFNGADGEFAAAVAHEGKRIGLEVEEQTRPQTPMPTMNNSAICTIKTISSANEIPKPTHHHRGARFMSTRLLTFSLREVKVTSGATTGGSGGSSLVSVIVID